MARKKFNCIRYSFDLDPHQYQIAETHFQSITRYHHFIYRVSRETGLSAALPKIHATYRCVKSIGPPGLPNPDCVSSWKSIRCDVIKNMRTHCFLSDVDTPYGCTYEVKGVVETACGKTETGGMNVTREDRGKYQYLM